MIPDATLTSFVFCVATLRDSLSCRAVGRSENMGEGVASSNPSPFEKDVFVSIPEIWGVGGFFSLVSDGPELLSSSHSASKLSGSIIIGKIF